VNLGKWNIQTSTLVSFGKGNNVKCHQTTKTLCFKTATLCST
jgi:hypothetical protein